MRCEPIKFATPPLRPVLASMHRPILTDAWLATCNSPQPPTAVAVAVPVYNFHAQHLWPAPLPRPLARCLCKADEPDEPVTCEVARRAPRERAADGALEDLAVRGDTELEKVAQRLDESTRHALDMLPLVPLLVLRPSMESEWRKRCYIALRLLCSRRWGPVHTAGSGQLNALGCQVDVSRVVNASTRSAAFV